MFPHAPRPNKRTPGVPWRNLSELRVDSPRAREILRGHQIRTGAVEGSDDESTGPPPSPPVAPPPPIGPPPDERLDADEMPVAPPPPMWSPPGAAVQVPPPPPTGPPPDDRLDRDAQLVLRRAQPDVDVSIADRLSTWWGVDASLCVTVVDRLLAVMRPRGDGGRQAAQHLRIHAGEVRQRLKPLWKIQSVAERYSDTFKNCSLLLTSPSLPHSRSFDDVFKEQSLLGFDLVNDRKIQYGNMAYKAFLLFACLHNPGCYENSLQAIATVGNVPSCEPSCDDTESSLTHMGDLVECMYAIARGSDFHDLRYQYDASEWSRLYSDSSGVFNSLNYLQCAMHGGEFKRTRVWMSTIDYLRLPEGLPNNTFYLAAVAYLLVTRADAP